MSNEKELIAAIDAGTTGIRCCIFDLQGNELTEGYYKVPTVYPKAGYVEQNATTVTELAFKAVAAAVSGATERAGLSEQHKTACHNDAPSKAIDPGNIIGLCITGQRNSFAPIDKTGKFITDMLIWQDQRGGEAHAWMREQLQKHGISTNDFYRMNGQPFGTFQSGNKAIWLRKFNEEVYNKTYKLVTPVAFLSKAFGAEDYFEENNDAGCWLVADADKNRIDTGLCNVFGLDPAKFLESVTPGTKVGMVSAKAAELTGLLQGTPIIIGSGDQQCGVLGAGNYGTADMMSVCMGTAGLCIAYSEKPVRHPDCLCNVQGHPAGGYTLEGHSSSCMSSFAWARDIMCSKGLNGQQTEMPDTDINAFATGLAIQAPVGSNGVLFLPYLQGAECPHYNAKARGAFIGMSLSTQKSAMIRSVMEGICFENRMMIETLQHAEITPVKTLRVIGGAANNIFWNQMQADIYGLPVETVSAKECTALGTAIIGSVACGVYANYKDAIGHMVHVKERYLPDAERSERYNDIYDYWNQCFLGLKWK